jgi:hypothetical protein
MAKSGDHRPWSVGLLFLSLTGAAYSHYYGVLLFLPFVLTEVAVGLRTRRWDWAVLLAVFSAGAALLPLTPIMLAVGGYAEMFSNPSVISVRELYGRVLGLPSVIFGLITLGAGLVGPPPPLPPVSSGSRRVLASSDGALLLLVFCLLPVVGFFMARLVTNAYADRYFIFTVVGFSIAFAVMLHARWWDRAWFAVGCVSALALLAALEVRHHYMLPEYRAGNSVAAAAAVAATRRLRQGTEPILVSDTYYLPVYYYGPSEVKGRLLFLDEDPSEHFSVAARRLEAVRPLAIISIKELFEKYPRFYVYMPSQRLMRELRRRSMQINSVDQNLYYVFPMPL